MDSNRTLTVTWADPRELAAAAAGLSGLEFLRAIAAGQLPRPPLGVLLGFSLLEFDEGRAVFGCTPGEQHYNPIGVVHGGLAAALLDSAMGCAVSTTLAAGIGYTTLELKINLVRAMTAETGPVVATGQVVHRGRRVATAEGRLVIRESGTLLAHATTTCMIMGG